MAAAATSTGTTAPGGRCGIDDQVRKAEQAVAGNAPVTRNRFIQLIGGRKSVNRELERKYQVLAGIKGYVTNLLACPNGTSVIAEFVINAYHQRDSIEAHLITVFAALAVSSWTEAQTGWSIRRFVKTARRYWTVQILGGAHTITAADSSSLGPRVPQQPDTPSPLAYNDGADLRLHADLQDAVTRCDTQGKRKNPGIESPRDHRREKETLTPSHHDEQDTYRWSTG